MPEVGEVVKVFPNKNSLSKFKNKKREFYAAIITDVNENSVDLTVFGQREMVYLSGIEHVDVADEGNTFYSE